MTHDHTKNDGPHGARLACSRAIFAGSGRCWVPNPANQAHHRLPTWQPGRPAARSGTWTSSLSATGPAPSPAGTAHRPARRSRTHRQRYPRAIRRAVRAHHANSLAGDLDTQFYDPNRLVTEIEELPRSHGLNPQIADSHLARTGACMMLRGLDTFPATDAVDAYARIDEQAHGRTQMTAARHEWKKETIGTERPETISPHTGATDLLCRATYSSRASLAVTGKWKRAGSNRLHAQSVAAAHWRPGAQR
jgi:hypothetical protein